MSDGLGGPTLLNRRSERIDPGARTLPGAAFAWLAASVLAIWALMPDLRGSGSGEVIAWYGIASVPFVALVVVNAQLTRRDPLVSRFSSIWTNIPMLIGVYYFVVTVVPGLAGLSDPSLVLSLIQHGTHYPWLVPKGLLLTTTGLLALSITYFALRGRRPMRVMARLGQRTPVLARLMILYVVSVAVRVVQIAIIGVAYGADSSRLGSATSLNQVVSVVGSLGLLVVFVVVNRLRIYGEGAYRGAAAGVVAIEFTFCVLSGFIKPFVALGLVLLFASTFGGARAGGTVRVIRATRLVLGGALVAVVVVIATPVVQAFRASGQGSSATRSQGEVFTRVQDAWDTSWGSGIGVGWQSFVDKSMGRQAGAAQAPAVALARIPNEIPYKGIDAFVSIPTGLVPRVLWPGKPVLTSGIEISEQIYRIRAGTTTSSTLSTFGEAYWYLGFVGVLVAGLVLGVAYRLLVNNTLAVGAAAVFAPFLGTLLDLDAQFSVVIIGLAQSFLVAALGYRLVTRKPRDRRVTLTKVGR